MEEILTRSTAHNTPAGTFSFFRTFEVYVPNRGISEIFTGITNNFEAVYTDENRMRVIDNEILKLKHNMHIEGNYDSLIVGAQPQKIDVFCRVIELVFREHIKDKINVHVYAKGFKLTNLVVKEPIDGNGVFEIIYNRKDHFATLREVQDFVQLNLFK